VLTSGSESFDALLKKTIDEAAAVAGISDSTLDRVMKAVGVELKRFGQREAGSTGRVAGTGPRRTGRPLLMLLTPLTPLTGVRSSRRPRGCSV
jgi:hypothetical protein